jgi:hypothetical protein
MTEIWTAFIQTMIAIIAGFVIGYAAVVFNEKRKKK